MSSGKPYQPAPTAQVELGAQAAPTRATATRGGAGPDSQGGWDAPINSRAHVCHRASPVGATSALPRAELSGAPAVLERVRVVVVAAIVAPNVVAVDRIA